MEAELYLGLIQSALSNIGSGGKVVAAEGFTACIEGIYMNKHREPL
jgi:hypothetical protein